MDSKANYTNKRAIQTIFVNSSIKYSVMIQNTWKGLKNKVLYSNGWLLARALSEGHTVANASARRISVWEAWTRPPITYTNYSQSLK